MANIRFVNSNTGMIKDVPSGFSWTTLFFGFFPALLRGDIIWALIMILVAILTLGISWWIFPFIYNGLHVNGLIKSGYKVSSTAMPDAYLQDTFTKHHKHDSNNQSKSTANNSGRAGASQFESTQMGNVAHSDANADTQSQGVEDNIDRAIASQIQQREDNTNKHVPATAHPKVTAFGTR
jgi:hypothetical protein